MMEYTCKNYPKLAEKIISATMPSGLQCLFIPKPGFKRKFAVLATPYGSINREVLIDGQPFKTPAGIAHFLEHKLFEDPNHSIENRFAALGASVNAYTTHTQTAYLFSTAENFQECLNILLDFVQKPAFTEQGVIDERSIIAQEIKMYNDQPNWAVYLGALQSMYGEHPVAEDIAGQVEDLEHIDYDLLKKCHQLFYHPERMVLVVSGDLDFKELFAMIEQNQKTKKFPPLPNLEHNIPRAQMTECAGPNKFMEVARPLFSLGIRDREVDSSQEAIRREQVASLLLEVFIGKNSPFYNRLYDEGLIDASFGVEYTSTPWYSHFIFGGESDNPRQLADELLAELKRLQECGINSQLFEQNLKKLTGLSIMDLNGLESIVMATSSDWLMDSSYFERFEHLRNIKKEDVEALLHSLDLDKSCLSVVNPLNS
ncbi:MAG: insulinase family protein [Firmicutes bacterium]|nr:insulinase family protein [Bacillota bacterium]